LAIIIYLYFLLDANSKYPYSIVKEQFGLAP
jgi:hypothetical protein